MTEEETEEETAVEELSELEEFAKSLRGKSQNTKTSYTKLLRRFEAVMGAKPAKKRTMKEVNEFLDYCEMDGLESGTIANYTIVLRQYFNYHGREDLSKKIKTPTIIRSKRRSVHWDYWMDMFEAAGYDSRNGDRNQALLAVLLGTGMRIGEAVKIRGKHIDWQNERIMVPRAKGKKEEVYYQMILLDALEAYLHPYSGRKTESYVFQGKRYNAHMTERNAEYIVHKIAMVANVPNAENITPHSLRHSLAHYLLYEKKWDSAIVQQVLNHARITTTQIYLEAQDLELSKFVRENR
jgi:integrase/recombinase XerD